METTTLEYFNRDIMEQLAALHVRTTGHEKRCVELATRNEQWEFQVQWYEQRFELLQRKLFGRKSERREGADGALPLFPAFSDEARLRCSGYA